MIVVNDGQSTETSYPANTAIWSEVDTDRYIRLETDGTISGEDARNVADVYAFVSGAWEKYDWDVFDAESVRTEGLPFEAEKFKVVFSNGLEWVITKEPV